MGKCHSREETQLFSSMEEANLQVVASSHHQILKKEQQQRPFKIFLSKKLLEKDLRLVWLKYK